MSSPFDEALSRPFLAPHSGNDINGIDNNDDSERKASSSLSTSSSSLYRKGRLLQLPPNLRKVITSSSRQQKQSSTSRPPSCSTAAVASHSKKYQPPTPASPASYSRTNSLPSDFLFHAEAGGGGDDDEADLQSRRDFHHSQHLHHSFMTMEELDLDEALVRERHEHFANIRNEMSQIHEIQQDLAVIVHTQQEDIDDVETNAFHTCNQTQKGMEYLTKASVLSRKVDGLRFASAVFALILFMALGVIAWLYLSK